MITPARLRDIAERNDNARWPDETNDAIDELREAADEIERLRVIVDSIPKLRDGTPITLGMVAYESTGLGHDGERISGFTTHPDGRLACLYFTDGTSIGFDTAVDCYYGTAEAAEKARKP